MKTSMIRKFLTLCMTGMLALPAAAILSVLVRFAYNRYLAEHPELRDEEIRSQVESGGESAS